MRERGWCAAGGLGAKGGPGRGGEELGYPSCSTDNFHTSAPSVKRCKLASGEVQAKSGFRSKGAKRMSGRPARLTPHLTSLTARWCGVLVGRGEGPCRHLLDAVFAPVGVQEAASVQRLAHGERGCIQRVLLVPRYPPHRQYHWRRLRLLPLPRLCFDLHDPFRRRARLGRLDRHSSAWPGRCCGGIHGRRHSRPSRPSVARCCCSGRRRVGAGAGGSRRAFDGLSRRLGAVGRLCRGLGRVSRRRRLGRVPLGRVAGLATLGDPVTQRQPSNPPAGPRLSTPVRWFQGQQPAAESSRQEPLALSPIPSGL